MGSYLKPAERFLNINAKKVLAWNPSMKWIGTLCSKICQEVSKLNKISAPVEF